MSWEEFRKRAKLIEEDFAKNLTGGALYHN